VLQQTNTQQINSIEQLLAIDKQAKDSALTIIKQEYLC